ncbi:hypothetical protein AXY46_23310 [Achromobacter xylosoxidans]|nr:hypothetical protein AXY46_23310 [Achromobacter xylosoxidans]
MRLGFQRRRGSRRLFDHRGRFLRGTFDIGHRMVDRRNAGGLLGGGIGNLGHDLRHAVDRGHHVAHGVARQIHMTHARIHARGRILDQALDLARRLGATLRQRPHFARHHGKPLALLARARRFHGCVERKDVRLERNAVHHAHDLPDAPRAIGDALHAVHHFIDGLAAALRQLRGACRLAACQVRVAGGHLNGMGQLRHVGRRFLQRASLARRAVRHIGAARRNLARAGVDLFHPQTDRGHGGRQPRLHAAHGRIQHTNFVVATLRDHARQVAVRNAVKVRPRLIQRPHDAAAESQPDQHCQHQDETQHGRRHHDHPFKRAACAGHRLLPLFAGVGLVDLGLLHIRSPAGRQRLVRQPVDLDAVPPLDRGAHRHERLVGKGGIRRQDLGKQRRALGAVVRVGAQADQAGSGLLQ